MAPRSEALTGPVGVSMATRSGLPAAEFAEIAAAAERAGFSAVFLAEGGSDVLALCASVVSATTTVTVGTAIANAHLHPPTLTAMTCATLGELSGGRFVLGLGTANPRLNHDVLVLPRHPPLAYMEEYLGTFRAVQSNRSFAGGIFQFAGSLAWDRPPTAPTPVHMAALQPRMLALAGRIADGVVLNLMSPQQCAAAVAVVREAAIAAGRSPADVSVTAVVQTCLYDDPAAAQAAAKGVVVNYSAHPSTAALFGAADAYDAMARVRVLASAGDRAGAVAAVPQEVADAFVVHGDAVACRAGLAEYRAAGVDLPVVFCTPVDGNWLPAYQDIVGQLGGRPVG